MFTIKTIEHFLTSEEDKQLHTQIPHYCLTNNTVACTTEMFMSAVLILPIFLLNISPNFLRCYTNQTNKILKFPAAHVQRTSPTV